MTQRRPFQDDLAGRLTDLAMPAVPAYRDDIVGRYATTRQRPAWTFPERWLPVDLTTERVSVAPIRWRPYAVAALVLLAVVAAALVAAGSRPRQQPAPLYGPAANGLIAYAADGDIYLGDPATGTSWAIVAGPDSDTNPAFSNDGLHLFFARARAEGLDFMLADADGSHARVITPAPIKGVTGGDWSADGRFMIVSTDWGGGKQITIVDVDRGSTRTLELDGFAGYEPVFRPPDGREIAFTYGELSGADIYVVDIAPGMTPRPKRSSAEGPLQHLAIGVGPRYSPDGTRIAYGRSYPGVDGNETRVMDADGSNDHIVGDRPDIQYQGSPVWSPDGMQLLVFRNSSIAGGVLAIVPADGSGPGQEFNVGFSEGFGDLGWSPDGSQIVSMPANERARATLVNLADGIPRLVPRWYTSSWQRRPFEAAQPPTPAPAGR